MQYRNLGRSGLKVSAIGLGTNRFGGKVDQAGVDAIIHEAVNLGINFIDTADIYTKGQSEETIGKSIKGLRQQVLIATKVRHAVEPGGPNDGGASRQHIPNGVEASLRRLDTDYIDLYQIHSWDDETPIEETMQTLDDLLRSGKVRYLGASNFSAWQLTHANALAELHGWTQFVSLQPHFHLLERKVEREILPAAQYFGIGILPYFPLAGGFLTGKYERGKAAPKGSRGEDNAYVQQYMTDPGYTQVEKLTAFAQEQGHTMNELAHAWLLAQPMVSSVISGATKVEQVVANARSADWQLTPEDLQEIRQILEA